MRWFQRLPDTKTIDVSGVLLSDYPYLSNGYIKGWAVDCPSRNIAIVARHASPSNYPPNNAVYAINRFGFRSDHLIVAVEYPDLPVAATKSELEYRNHGDVAVVRVSPSFSEHVTCYRMARYVENNQKSVVMTPGGPSEAFIATSKDPWLKGRKRSKLLIGGNSGLPWFVWSAGEWRVASHTTKGDQGQGPQYTHPDVLDKLQECIDRLARH